MTSCVETVYDWTRIAKSAVDGQEMGPTTRRVYPIGGEV